MPHPAWCVRPQVASERAPPMSTHLGAMDSTALSGHWSFRDKAAADRYGRHRAHEERRAELRCFLRHSLSVHRDHLRTQRASGRVARRSCGRSHDESSHPAFRRCQKRNSGCHSSSQCYRFGRTDHDFRVQR
jgi:hypothetical protein